MFDFASKAHYGFVRDYSSRYILVMNATETPVSARRSIDANTLPQPIDSSAAFCVMYDGSCPLCLREIGMYRSAVTTEPIQWVDVSQSGVYTAEQQHKLMARFHIQDSHGQMLSGAAAFVALWERVPGWRLLAKIVKSLHLTPVLEFGYVRFLRIRPQLQKLARLADVSHLPQDLVADIRSDHAGETGAVYIYKGILAVSRDPAVIAFANEHLRTEQEHLKQISALLPPLKRSLLLPGWKIAGFITGALPALFGTQSVYATIQAVETFVDKHYEHQIQALAGRESYKGIRDQLLKFQADEVSHRDEASHNQAQPPGVVLKTWCAVVGWGSSFAVKLARLV